MSSVKIRLSLPSSTLIGHSLIYRLIFRGASGSRAGVSPCPCIPLSSYPPSLHPRIPPSLHPPIPASSHPPIPASPVLISPIPLSLHPRALPPPDEGEIRGKALGVRKAEPPKLSRLPERLMPCRGFWVMVTRFFSRPSQQNKTELHFSVNLEPTKK